MKTTLKNSLYTIAGSSLILLNKVNAAWLTITGPDVNQWLVWSDASADVVIQAWVARVATFLYIIAVIIIIWAWFQILTASWDEEKTKKWKTIIIQASIWLLVIFIASSIIQWIITYLFTGTA